MSVPSYPFHSLLLKLPNKGMKSSFPSLKLLNKGRKEYSKMILFIPFHSLIPNETYRLITMSSINYLNLQEFFFFLYFKIICETRLTRLH